MRSPWYLFEPSRKKSATYLLALSYSSVSALSLKSDGQCVLLAHQCVYYVHLLLCSDFVVASAPWYVLWGGYMTHHGLESVRDGLAALLVYVWRCCLITPDLQACFARTLGSCKGHTYQGTCTSETERTGF